MLFHFSTFLAVCLHYKVSELKYQISDNLVCSFQATAELNQSRSRSRLEEAVSVTQRSNREKEKSLRQEELSTCRNDRKWKNITGRTSVKETERHWLKREQTATSTKARKCASNWTLKRWANFVRSAAKSRVLWYSTLSLHVVSSRVTFDFPVSK